MTEPDPITTKDFSKIERGLSDLYRPVSIDPEFSSRSEKKLVERHQMKSRSFWRRFSTLRGRNSSFGSMVTFTAFLVIMVILILVIETLTRPSSVQPASRNSGDAITPTPTKISTLTPRYQATSTVLPAVLPTKGVLPAPLSNDQRVVSPDGRWAADFNSETGGLEIVKISGPNQSLLAKGITVYGASWSPNGAMLAVSLSQPGADPAATRVAEIWLSQVNGDALSEMKPFYTPGNSSGGPSTAGLQVILGAWSPDSSQLLFWQGMMSASITADGLPLWVIEIKTGNTKQIADTTLVNPGYQSWSPDSRALVFSNGGYRSAQVMKWLSLYQVDSGQTTDLVPATQLVPGDVAWAPDGKEIAFAAVDAAKTGMELADYMSWENPAILARRIYLLDIKTGEYRRLDQTEAYQDAPRWAGSHLLFVQMGQNQVTLMDANLETGAASALPGCQAELPPVAGYYGQTDWKSLYDSCKSVSH